MSRLRTGGILLAAMVALPSLTRAGLPLRVDEGRPALALDRFRRPKGFLPAGVKSTWSRLLDSVEASRDVIPKAALLDRGAPRGPSGADLGDGFLQGFARERGLNKKLRVLASYRIALSRARGWLRGQDQAHASALAEGMAALTSEADAAQDILIRQIGGDLARGGKALSVVVEHVNRAGFTEEIADEAFGGLARGLKHMLVRLASSGEIAEDVRQNQAQLIQALERTIRGA